MNHELTDDTVEAEAEIGGDEYEEITSDEVDRVVEALDALMETIVSENIRTYLEEASENIYQLIYEETAVTDEEADIEAACEPEDIDLIDDSMLNEAA